MIYIALTTAFIVHRLGCRHKIPTNIQPRLPARNKYLFNGVKSKLVATAANNITILADHFNIHSEVIKIVLRPTHDVLL